MCEVNERVCRVPSSEFSVRVLLPPHSKFLAAQNKKKKRKKEKTKKKSRSRRIDRVLISTFRNVDARDETIALRLFHINQVNV